MKFIYIEIKCRNILYLLKYILHIKCFCSLVRFCRSVKHKSYKQRSANSSFKIDRVSFEWNNSLFLRLKFQKKLFVNEQRRKLNEEKGGKESKSGKEMDLMNTVRHSSMTILSYEHFHCTSLNNNDNNLRLQPISLVEEHVNNNTYSAKCRNRLAKIAHINFNILFYSLKEFHKSLNEIMKL